MEARFGFVGVTASRSSINQVFPVWADLLGLGPVRLEPIDLPLDTPAARYREVVRAIAADPAHRGALVTSHKVRLLRAATDLFDELDPLAELTGEVSSISKRDGRLRGHAKDPITAGLALAEFLPAGHFAGGSEVLCLGAGGSGLAIALHLATRPDPADQPVRITLVNRGEARLAECRAVLDTLDTRTRFAYHAQADPRRNDELVAALPPGSLVVNATGLGKDRPGSPTTSAGVFPQRGLAWELNYRGELVFLDQARAQQQRRQLTVGGRLGLLRAWLERGHRRGVRPDPGPAHHRPPLRSRRPAPPLNPGTLPSLRLSGLSRLPLLCTHIRVRPSSPTTCRAPEAGTAVELPYHRGLRSWRYGDCGLVDSDQATVPVR